MKILRNAAEKASAAAGIAHAIATAGNPCAAAGQAAAPLVLAVGALAFGTFLVTGTGRAILAELRRRRRLRAVLPPSASLRGNPTDAELATDCDATPRTLAVRLRLGSRLADLEPSLDSTLHCETLPNGQKRIRSRARGLKGYLADRRLSLGYSTLVRYKKLAQRLRILLALDTRLPLEWLLPDTIPDRPVPPDLLTGLAAAKRRLARLLRENSNFDRLKKHVEAKLGIPRLLAVRRGARRPKRLSREQRQKPIHCESVVLGNRCILLEEDLVQSTKRDLILFLTAPDLPPRLDKLRRRALDWLQSTSL